ncbi:hypothetical protein BOTBODRAFT_58114 [Botryobasidium botryosum FD-172 SS1]|uniref:Uncharacterized protein n=1 Tax=Botryobasidium botryosum (strain FD-172 SS1) TaxID=930990 RepID=A0A067MFP6_BOTB1|nr:hypothetical protein BOTBODRAFT_58114 [Botryobasidium botryosum FD-172 SS1]
MVFVDGRRCLLVPALASTLDSTAVGLCALRVPQRKPQGFKTSSHRMPPILVVRKPLNNIKKLMISSLPQASRSSAASAAYVDALS